jgi:hypothetical protein
MSAIAVLGWLIFVINIFRILIRDAVEEVKEIIKERRHKK